MNNCTHYESLRPIPNTNEFICTSCGWKFLVVHITDYELQTDAEIITDDKGKPVMVNLSSQITEISTEENKVLIKFKRKDVGFYTVSFDKNESELIGKLGKSLREDQHGKTSNSLQ